MELHGPCQLAECSNSAALARAPAGRLPNDQAHRLADAQMNSLTRECSLATRQKEDAAQGIAKPAVNPADTHRIQLSKRRLLAKGVLDSPGAKPNP